jgi:protein-tyrosine phosphatase
MASGASRHLELAGCFNARDLGGLGRSGGGVTRQGALVRADTLDGLSAEGWQTLLDHGIRTVIDLRNEDERQARAVPPPDAITTVELPLDCHEDRAFWEVWEAGPQFGTPLYYRPHIERFPDRSARVIRTIAHARPGGVLFHCGAGRDRAGQIAMLSLALAGVRVEEIAADYELSNERLSRRPKTPGTVDEVALLRDFLAAAGTSGGQIIRATLAALDVEATLRAGGLSSGDLQALRSRLIEWPVSR